MRTVFLHVGTHKTGTTSLQNSLSANERFLREAGVYVPRAGRCKGWGGHHNIAWELNGETRFNPSDGSLTDLLTELDTVEEPVICVSSEDFEYLHAKPAALRRLADGFTRAGYQTAVVLYLRPQASYAESLYAELVRHGFTQSFADYLAAILRDGEIGFGPHWRFTFDYERLIDRFSDVFGAGQVLVRAYPDGMPGARLSQDFFRLIGVCREVDLRRVREAKRLNRSLPFIDVVKTYRDNINAAGYGDGRPLRDDRAYRSRFDPVHLPEVERIAQRFAGGNRRVSERYGATIRYVSRRDLLYDVAAAIGLHGASEKRRRFLHEQSRLVEHRTAAVASLPEA